MPLLNELPFFTSLPLGSDSLPQRPVTGWDKGRAYRASFTAFEQNLPDAVSLTLFQRNGKATARFICQCSTLTYFRTLLRNSLISALASVPLSFPTPPPDRCARVNCQDIEKWRATQALRCRELTVENKIAWIAEGSDLFLDFHIHFKIADSENSNFFFLIYVLNSSTVDSVKIRVGFSLRCAPEWVWRLHYGYQGFKGGPFGWT